MRRLLIAAALLAVAAPAAAQNWRGDRPSSDLRLQNEQRRLQSEQRALEADLSRLRTDQTVSGLERRRLPDPVLERRTAAEQAAYEEALLRAGQAQSTARAARLREGLAAFGYADSLPIAPRR